MKQKKTGSLLQIGCFLGFLALWFVLRLVLPKSDFSENENRYLAAPPKLTLSALVSGGFTADYESYITDQFPLRDLWISLKSRTERLSGKTENNDVFFCREDTLITRLPQPDPAQVKANTAALRALSENNDVQVCLALIPTAAAIWSDRLPKHANTADQAALIAQIYADSGLRRCADVYGALADHAAEDLYYRTDHHWTTLGAYYGYAATATALGLTPTGLDHFPAETVSDSFYGTVYSSSGVRWVAPDCIQRRVSDQGVAVTRYDGAAGKAGLVYDQSKLTVKDKYAYFFGGNTPRLVIETGAPGGKLLVLRDSYADSELGYFFGHYSEIHMLDLRYYRQSVAAYIKDNGVDTVLVNYSISNFVSDTSVFLMGT